MKYTDIIALVVFAIIMLRAFNVMTFDDALFALIASSFALQYSSTKN